MSDRNPANGMNLADALRAMPLAAPERSAWPQLAAQLKREKGEGRRERGKAEHIRRFVIPTALAAALIGVFVVTQQMRVIPNPESRIPSPQIATVAPGHASSSANSAQVGEVHNAAIRTDTTQLAALEQRSQDLERWLRETGNAAAPLQGQDLAAATEIENLIGLVDVELAAPREMRDARLWQRRVDLLEDLSALRYSNYQLAAGGRVIAASLTN